MWPFPSFATFLTWSCLGLSLIAICPNTSLAQYKSASFLQRADSLQTLRLYSLAIAQYQKAMASFEVDELWEEYVAAANAMGKVYTLQGEYQKTIDYLSNQLKKCIEKLGPEHILISEMYQELGDCHFIFQNPEALDVYKKALKINQSNFGDKHPKVGQSYYDVGRVYWFTLSDAANAESYLKKSLEIREQVLDSLHPDLGKCFYTLASIYRTNMEFEKASLYSQGAYRIFKSNPDNQREFRFANIQLANNKYAQDHFDDAIDLYQEGIQLTLRQVGPKNQTLVYLYNNLGRAYAEIGAYQNALNSIESALEINWSLDIIDSVSLSDSYINKGYAFFRSNDFKAAKRNYQQSLDICLNAYGEKHQQTAQTYREFGDLYLEADSVKKALYYYQKALIALVKDFNKENVNTNPSLTSGEVRNALFEIIYSKARSFTQLYETNGNLEDLKNALELYVYADDLLDMARNSDLLEGSQLYLSDYFNLSFGEGIQCAYQLYQLTKSREYLDRVFRFMEKSKYMLVFQSLSQVQNNHQLGIPDSIRQQELDLKLHMTEIKKQLMDEMDKDPKDQDKIDQLQNSILRITRSREVMREKIAENYPKYFEIKYDSLSLNLSQLQNDLLDQNTHILDYHWGRDAVFAMRISKEEIVVIKIDSIKDLEPEIRHYLHIISHFPNLRNSAIVGKSYEQFCELSQGLYEKLIKPLVIANNRGLTEKPAKLIIIPSGLLSFIPFESLITEAPTTADVNFRDLSYLIKDFQISYAFSANLYFKEVESKDFEAPRLLAFSYSKDVSGSETQSRTSGSLELPGSARELKAIQSVFGNHHNLFINGTEATEHQFKRLSPDFNIIHLAIHGVADTNNELNSKLIFKTAQDSVEDGQLFAYELYNLDLAALKLAVLSACETGLGREFKGEGLFSMARGFAYAGCPSVIMSLWRVNDRATADLMENFYYELQNGLSIDEALRIAKLDFLRSSDEFLAHPANWSAFIPMGDVSPIKKSSTPILYWVLGLFSLLLIIVFVSKFRIRKNPVVAAAND